MVQRGRELAEAYNDALDAYWSDDGSDSELELNLYRQFSKAQFDLEYHVQKLNTIRAVFNFFGRVY